MEKALGLGHKVFIRCKLGWNGIILRSEKFLKEIKGEKGDRGVGRSGEREGYRECFMGQEDKVQQLGFYP